ncbi:MAG: TonB-dependent receptor, partial [Flavobacteriaceae bacterium]|nr:TonB-dependent receptor [Flavobacteriaceae bacterium]
VSAFQLKKWYFEPRVAASVNITEELKFNAAWGLYNQFMAKTSIVDSSYNFSYFWTNSDGVDIPVLHAGHFVGGISYNKNGLTLSAETYYKTTAGINRFFNGTRGLARGFYNGEGRSYGLDLYIKKEYKKHMAWVSYSLSKTEEHFPFFVRKYYKLAPHHQTHEIKFAGILNLKSFYLSADYVYGSGFERYNIETADGTWLNQDYKRLDAALVYKLPAGKIKGEVGVSVLNVLNTSNIKYSNLRRATVDEINLVGIYAEAVPFTPAVFLKIEL